MTTLAGQEIHPRMSVRQFVEKTLPHADDALPPVVPPPSGPRLIPRPLRGASALHGSPVSPGMASGRAVILTTPDPLAFVPPGALPGTPRSEESLARRAIDQVGADIERSLSGSLSTLQRGILKAHLAIVRDAGLLGKVQELLSRGGSMPDKRSRPPPCTLRRSWSNPKASIWLSARRTSGRSPDG